VEFLGHEVPVFAEFFQELVEISLFGGQGRVSGAKREGGGQEGVF
jgi:hypothetical protein